MAKRKEKYSFWIGRLEEDGTLELWLEFFEPKLALDWKRKHFPGEDDVICVEHHESGKLSSSGRKTLRYWPEWADGDNWRRIGPDCIRQIDLLLAANASRVQKAKEARTIRDLEEKKRAFELATAKEDAYGMPEEHHRDLTANIEEDKR